MSEATRRLNAHLLAGHAVQRPTEPATAGGMAVGPKRLRQDSRPLMNGLETAFAAHLRGLLAPEVRVVPQGKRYRLANGQWYKPDFTAVVGGREHAWECKGPKAFRGGFENLKTAATMWPDVTFTLVWRDAAGAWQQQKILP